MAVISREHGMLFLLNPRTGGTAVAQMMLDHLGGEWVPTQEITSPAGGLVLQVKHNTARELVAHGIIDRSDLAHLTVFTTVRNPYDSVLSLYLKLRDRYAEWVDHPEHEWIRRNPRIVANIEFCRTHGFDAWIRHEFGRAAIVSALARRPSSLHSSFTADADVVLRFEHLESDLTAFLADRGIEPPPFAALNPTEGRLADYRDAYSLLSRLILRTALSADFRDLGYRFG